MKLKYLPVRFFLEFESAARPDVYPVFVLRSMLGKNLRQMNCIARQNECGTCMFNKSCAYAYIFETILSEKNNIVPGRNRAAHPFAFTRNDKCTGEMNKFNFTITLFGRAIEYLPYVYASFLRAGNSGIFKERTRFVIPKLEVYGKNILINEAQIDTENELSEIEFVFSKFSNDDGTQNVFEGEILVELKSPLRFRVNGDHAYDFCADDFFKCLERRVKSLIALYGEAGENQSDKDFIAEPGKKFNKKKCQVHISEKDLYWQEYTHYSARQKDVMQLGGLMGSFKLAGIFSETEMFLLETAQTVNAGKNPGFGFGQIEIWKK